MRNSGAISPTTDPDRASPDEPDHPVAAACSLMKPSVQAHKRKESIVSSAKVADFVCARIVAGQFVPGQRLVEADIMRETGATRGRVREALKRLAVEGLIVIQEFRGASVRRMTREEIDQIYHARAVLEGLCARLVAERAGEETLGQLRALQHDMDRHESKGDSARYAVVNERWHALLISGSGNGIVQTFLKRLRIPIVAAQFRRVFTLQALRKSNARHRRVTDAILAREADLAERRMREHILEVLEDLSGRGDEFF